MALKFLFNALSGKFDLVDSGGGAVTNPLTADLDADGFKVVNLLDPTADQDAATKKYVDDNSGGGGGSGNSYFPGGW